MVDEKDISMEMGWYLEHLAQKAIPALRKNNFDAEYVASSKEALDKVIERIPSGATIGCGDSVTLYQIGFIDWLGRQKDHEVFNPFSVQRCDFPDEDWVKFRTERFRLQQKALTANAFVTGTNAITLDGKLVNIDGHGNRVAAMIFGPNKVIVVSGANKIVNNVDDAIKKIHEWIAPINVKRHVEKHSFNAIAKLPCATTGMCSYCRNENRICRITTIIDGWSPFAHCPTEYQPSIIVVGESLGI